MTNVLEDDSTSRSTRTLIDQSGPQNLVVLDWAASTAQGSQRLRNEDSWAQLGPVFAIADGMGGLDAGDLASKVATRALLGEWSQGDEPNPLRVVKKVNAQVRSAMFESDGGGTTMSAIRIAHDQATIVHVGDSRLYRLRSDQPDRLTQDHNLRTELLSAGIEPKSTQSFGPLRALTSYLGMPTGELRVDVRSVALRDGDVLVLCTDGVFDGLSYADFVDIVRTARADSAAVVASRLTSKIGPDDASAVVVKIGTADLNRARG